MQRPTVIPLDDTSAKHLAYLLSRETLSDPKRIQAVLAYRQYELDTATDQLSDIETAIAAHEISLQSLKKAKTRAEDNVRERAEDLKNTKAEVACLSVAS